jgi:hypothetical protein
MLEAVYAGKHVARDSKPGDACVNAGSVSNITNATDQILDKVLIVGSIR